MNKKFPLGAALLLGLLVSLSAWAAPISERQAMAIASNFMSGRLAVSPNMKMAHSQPRLNASATGGSGSAYYVFNSLTSRGGYVIVAGDDRAPAVLGYSDGGTFDAAAIPPAMQEMLEDYAAQIEALDAGCKSARLTQPGAGIAPLVSSNWSQNAPYNIKLPYLSTGKHAVVGCVGTAMAQVMNYYKWPQRPTQALPSYTSKALSISMPELPVVNFDWDAMQDIYWMDDTASASALAAATLSLYCAQSVHTNFMIGGSSAPTGDILLAFINYFDYSPAVHLIKRDCCSAQEWTDIIYGELAASRPVIYVGYKVPSGGHAFICDGYDGNGMFHINWGWGGNGDGYFLLNVLDSEIVRGQNSVGGYIRSQDAVVGIEPYVEGAADAFGVSSYDVAMVESNGTRTSTDEAFCATVTAYIQNSSATNTSFSIGWGVFRGDEMISLVNCGIRQLALGYYSTLTREVTFGAGLTGGTYRIMPICSESNAGNWRPCAGASTNYVEATITGNTCTFTVHGAMGEKKYSVEDIKVDGTMHIKRPVDITLSLTNRGESGNELLYMFVDGTFASAGYVSLLKGETGEVAYHYTPTTAGSHTLSFTFNKDGSNPIATHVITIDEVPDANLTATVVPLNVTDAVNKVMTASMFSVGFTVTNAATSPCDEEIAFRLFESINGNGGIQIRVVNKRVSLAVGETKVLRIDFDQVKDGRSYSVIASQFINNGTTYLARTEYYKMVIPKASQYPIGDVNHDGEVNIADVNMLVNLILSADGANPQADVNGDGEVNVADVNTVIELVLDGNNDV